MSRAAGFDYGRSFHTNEIPERFDGAPIVTRGQSQVEAANLPMCGRCGVEWKYHAAVETFEDGPHTYLTWLYVPHCQCWRLGTLYGIQGVPQ